MVSQAPQQPAQSRVPARIALGSPEILNWVLLKTDQRERATAAQVSRQWSARSLDLLWKDLPCLLPLINIIKPLVYADKIWVSVDTIKTVKRDLLTMSSTEGLR